MKKIVDFKDASHAMKYIDYMRDCGFKHMLYLEPNIDNSGAFDKMVDDEHAEESRKYIRIVMERINQDRSIVDSAERIINLQSENDEEEQLLLQVLS